MSIMLRLDFNEFVLTMLIVLLQFELVWLLCGQCTYVHKDQNIWQWQYYLFANHPCWTASVNMQRPELNFLPLNLIVQNSVLTSMKLRACMSPGLIRLLTKTCMSPVAPNHVALPWCWHVDNIVLTNNEMLFIAEGEC